MKYRPFAFGLPSSHPNSAWRLAFWMSLAAVVGGCSFLKPARPAERFFVLTPITTNVTVSGASNRVAIGVAKVKLPGYLFGSAVTMRKDANELQRLPAAVWAERLDVGFQRVLGANLAVLLSTDRLHLSLWQKEDVMAEVHVTIEQFDVDKAGQGVLVVRWRIISPGGEKVLMEGGSRLSRQGPAPDVDTSAAIATLNGLLDEFSRQMAEAIGRFLASA